MPASTLPSAPLLLESVTPLALEVALTVQAELEARADEADALRRSHVERARHRAELARRRYLAVDPDNRLVADSLEADWNDALRQLRDAQDDYERAAAAAKTAFTEEQKSRIRALATDFPRLWSDPATPQRERKRMARLLIEDVTINKSDKIYLGVRFRGGKTTSLAVPLPPTSWQTRQTDPATLAALDQLLDEHTDAQTAELLNRHGHFSGTGSAVHPENSVAPTSLQQAAEPSRTAEGQRAPHHTRSCCSSRRAHLHRQGLAPRRPACLSPSKRQEPQAFRATCTRRPSPRQKAWAPALQNELPTHPSTGGAV